MEKIVRLFRRYDFPWWGVAAMDHAVSLASRLVSSWALRLFLIAGGCEVGPGLKADGWVTVRLRKRGTLNLGRGVAVNSRFGSNWAGLNHRTVWQVLDDGRIEIGDHAGMSGVVLSSRRLIRIGRHTLLGAGVRIYDHDFHPVDAEARRGEGGEIAEIPAAAVELGSDVFVGAAAIILKGVRIGDRSVVGAGSVVRKGDYPADSLIMGNPAVVVRKRE